MLRKPARFLPFLSITFARQLVSVACALFILASGIGIYISVYVNGFGGVQFLVATLLCILAAGLFKGISAFLKVTARILLLVAITLPVIVFNPLAVGDYLASSTIPPEFPEALFWVIPLDLFLLASAYLLDLPLKSQPPPSNLLS
jgi:hypothetical protein